MKRKETLRSVDSVHSAEALTTSAALSDETLFSLTRIAGVLMAMFGMSFQWAMLHSITFAGTIFRNDGLALYGDAWIVNSIATFVIFMLLFILSRRIGSILTCRGLLAADAACLISGVLLLCFGYIAPEFVLAIYAGNVLVACGATPLIVAWGEMYRYLNPKAEQLFVTLGAIIVSVVIYMIEVNLSLALAVCIFVMLPVGSLVCLTRTLALLERSSKSWRARSVKPLEKSPLLFLVCIIVFSIPYNYLRGDSGTEFVLGSAEVWSNVLATTITVMVIVTIAEVFAEQRGILLVPGCVLIFISAAMILSMVTVGDSFVLMPALLYSGYYLFLAMVYLALGPIVAATETDSIRLFSSAMIANVGGLLIGTVLGGLNSWIGGEAATMVVLTVTYIILLAGMALLHGRSYSLFRINSFDEEDYSFEFLASAGQAMAKGAMDRLPTGMAYTQSSFGIAAELCPIVGEKYGLSGREEEVLSELVRGKTISSIAEDLFLSENTIKAHTKAIYRKLGVHSREELFECVERTSEMVDSQTNG